MPAQAVQPELHRAQAHPVAAAEYARAPRRHLPLRGDRQVDAAPELDTVRALVEVDEDRQRMGRRGVAKGCPRYRFGRLWRELTLGRDAPETHGRADFGEVAGHDAAAEDRFRPGEMGDARGDLPAREHLHDRE